MNKVAHYLQEHLTGELMTGDDARKYFATDGSILTIPPAIIVYPRNENDVRKAARFAWQLAERGRVIPITARGSGTDLAGAAIGPGIIMAFPAHLNKVLELDGKSGMVTVEPGVNYGKLQQTLLTHNRFLPPYPASMEYSTIGGAVANNAAGEKSLKYGTTRDFVRELRIVLANGEVIETRRLSKRELNKKLGLSTFEGEVYRGIDALIEENTALLKDFSLPVTRNNAGYALQHVKRKDGSFDLTPLLVGAQGTLGLITEVVMATEPHNPNVTLIAARVDDLSLLTGILTQIRNMSDSPSSLEMVDGSLLEMVHTKNPNLLGDFATESIPKLMLFVEFDSSSERTQKRMVKKALKIFDKAGIETRVETESSKRDELLKIRHSVATLFVNGEGSSRALPIIEDGVVPVDRLAECITQLHQLFARYRLKPAVWGHAGDGHIHVQPMFDLAQLGDRQKMFKLMEEYYAMVLNMGGTTTGEHGDGRLRGPYLERLYGKDMYELFIKTKQIFDPYNVLNTGVKIGVQFDDIKGLLRSEYSLEHFHEHMPRT